MNSIDFLPERVVAERSRRRSLVRQGYILAACVACLVGVGYFRQGRISQANAALVALQNNAVAAQQQVRVRDELERQQADLMVMQRIENDLGSRAGVLDVLSELQSVMPESVALSDLTMESMEVPVVKTGTVKVNKSNRAAGAKEEAKAINRVRVVISGISPTDVDVANFIGQLSASPLFEDVNMGYARNTDFRGRVAREFQVSCYIRR